MGAGARTDPTRIRVADLRESTNDPLSRAVIFLAFRLRAYSAAFNDFVFISLRHHFREQCYIYNSFRKLI